MSHDLLPRKVDVVTLSGLSTYSESQDKDVTYTSRRHVNPFACVHFLVQLLVHLIRSLESEANESQGHWTEQLESRIRENLSLELLCQSHVLPNEGLQSFDSKRAEDEPHLERPEASAQRDLPVTVVRDFALHLVPQVDGVHIKGIHDVGSIFDPKS